LRESFKKKIIEVCKRKIEAKGSNVGLSFYAFFANKNDDPELLMEVAEWWIWEKSVIFSPSTLVNKSMMFMGFLVFMFHHIPYLHSLLKMI